MEIWEGGSESRSVDGEVEEEEEKEPFRARERCLGKEQSPLPVYEVFR